jgi:dTDP-4-amino-4,6-dideoxygalactose transaminase|tara:strand:- start:869 stop:1924 length:1056 start_codon:yes stop_codon:yes gene_type:complete
MTGWDREYLANKNEYLKLFDNVMQKENERNVEFLEKRIAKTIGRKFAVAVNSGTDALHFSLIINNIGPGDEVLVTNFSWISSASVVSMVGATPVFCDVDLETNHISVDSMKRMYSDKVKAIIYPHLFGNISDMQYIQKFCEEKNIKLIEDACQSFGANRDGQHAGTYGDVSTLSFNANKPVAGLAGGGAFLTDNKEEANLVRKLRRHGNNEVLGYNSKMLAINAEFINFRMDKMHEWQDMRFRIAKRYTNNLKNLPVIIPHVDEIVNHCYHKYVIRLENKETRDKLQKRLNANVHYPNPISENPMYKSILNRKDNCLNSQLICDTILTLPIHPYLTNDEIDKTCTSIMMTV